MSKDLYPYPKRPVLMSKETCIDVKRDLCCCQKRPVSMSKETCIHVNGYLYIFPKIPMYKKTKSNKNITINPIFA